MDAIERRRQAGEEAADWFARLQTDDLPRAERAQFVDWLRESSLHVAEMLRVAQVHGALEQFSNWARVTTDGPQEDSVVVSLNPSGKFPAQAQTRRDGRRGMWMLALAATVVGVLLMASALWPRLRGQIIDTNRGERREVLLSDGSVVKVDAQTRLRMEFSAHSRRIVLEHGRALFRVARDSNRPFVVQADDTVVRALGTAFGVDKQNRGVVVTVTEGKVAIPAAGTAIFLTASQQVTVRRAGAAEPVRTVDSSRELAWVDGRLIFKDDKVAKVVAEFNRYNRLQLRVSDAALANRLVSGVFSASDPESFIAFIQTVAPVRVIRGDDQDVTISSNHPQ